MLQIWPDLYHPLLKHVCRHACMYIHTNTHTSYLTGYQGTSPGNLDLLLSYVSTEDMFNQKAMFPQNVLGSGSFMRSAEIAAANFAGALKELPDKHHNITLVVHGENNS